MVLNSMLKRTYLVIGASRGLGASIISKCLEHGLNVVGVGRTEEINIKSIAEWRRRGRFKYIQMDIGDKDCKDKLRGIISSSNDSPLCVIFNAAVTESDVGIDGNINFDVFYKTNYTGINGLAHTLEAFENHLTLHGGILVGISSISAWIPPTGGSKIAYPASKAYMDMALRSLRLLWDKRVHVMTVHLGHISRDSNSWFIPGYNAVAQKIVKATLRKHPPENICMSTIYCITYSIIRMMPDRVVSIAVKIVNSLLNRILPGKKLQ